MLTTVDPLLLAAAVPGEAGASTARSLVVTGPARGGGGRTDGRRPARAPERTAARTATLGTETTVYGPERPACAQDHGPEHGALALNKGIDDPPEFPDPKRSGCKRIPDYYHLVDRLSGECVPLSCRATNLCEHCRNQRAALIVEMLQLDALEGDAPTLALLLTARRFPELPELRRTYDQLSKALRRRWPGFRWFLPKEQQRNGQMHVHPLVKGIPTDEASMREAYEIVTRIWCSRHDAIAYPYDRRQDGPQGLVALADAGGFVRYLHKELAHSLKSSQSLPLGFRGHRTTHSRPRKDGTPGYFTLGTQETQERARRSLRERRLAYTLTQRGITGQEAQDLITTELERPRDWFMTGFGYPESQTKRLQREKGDTPCPPPPSTAAMAAFSATTTRATHGTPTTPAKPSSTARSTTSTPGSIRPRTPALPTSSFGSSPPPTPLGNLGQIVTPSPPLRPPRPRTQMT